MKILLAALMLLLAFAATASAAESVEIRSSVLHFETVVAASAGVILDYSGWAGFYYDLDDNVQTEKITAIQVGGQNPNQLNFVYETAPISKSYAYDGWADTSAVATNFSYAIIGFFAEPYVALGSKSVTSATPLAVNASKIAKLIIDDDEKVTLKTGATLELGSGYSVIVDQIDVDGNKAYLKLMKDGQELNSSIVNTNETGLNASTWIFELTVLGEKDMQVMRVHVKDVFQGTESSLVEIDGLWMVDYLNAQEVKADDKYGKFECDEASKTLLKFTAENVSFSADADIELGAGIFVKTEQNFDINGHEASPTPATPDLDKFYLYKVYTTPGEYEIRSTVFDYAGTVPNFTFENFAAFFYDMDNSIDTEMMNVTIASGVILEGKLIYTTQPKNVSYEYNWTREVSGSPVAEEYYVMGLFGEKYVPANIVSVAGTYESLKAEKMAKLVIDDDEKVTLKTGATLELGEGYSVIVDQIDVDGNKAYLRFLKDGQEVNSSIVNTRDNTSNWIFRNTLLNEKNVQLFRIHVKDVFQGTQDSLVEIDGIWLMDYVNATELKSGDDYVSMEYVGTSTTLANGAAIVADSEEALKFESSSNITVSVDMDKQIANNLYLKTADNDTAKNAYFYVKATVDGANTTPEPPVDTPPVDTPPVDTPPADTPGTDEPPVAEESWFAKNMWYIIGAIVLIIIIGGAAYYFMVMKKA
ncbi:MAG: hypothetical protein LBU81_00655 [Methanosarcinales archaeon]|nr:hypothetical protein [Methanosarcinales archaeon]